VRHIQEEEETPGGRVSLDQVQYYAENNIRSKGRQFDACSKDQVHEGRRSVVADQRSAAYGKDRNVL